MPRSVAIKSSLLAFACAAFISAHALADSPKRIDVPPGELALALRQLAEQSGAQFIYSARSLAGIRTAGVRGEYTANAALAKLLEGTQLQLTVHESGAVLISQPSSSSTSSSTHLNTPETKEKSFWGRLRLARADRGRSAAAGGSARVAQQNPESPMLEEIIVTAQKRAERLIDVPISIAVLGADDLQKRNITSIDRLRASVPGMTIIGSGGFQRRIMLRGISNTFGGASLIGMYLDEAPVTTSGPTTELDLRTYDLERAEVLRGPQGTLYGAGSAGGTIRFITENPRLDRFTARTDLTASFTQDGEPSQRIEGVLNVPLIGDELGLRVAGTLDRQAGWMDQPALGRRDIHGEEVFHVRAKGLWQPAPQFAVNAMAVVHRNDGALGSQGEDANGNYTQLFNLPTTPTAQDDYDIYNLTLTHDFAAARLLSSTSYIGQDKDARNFGSGAQVFAPPAPRRSFVYFLNASDSRIWAEEVRLTSRGEGAWQWTAGGYYRHARDQGLLIYSVDAVNRVHAPSRGRSESMTVFGDVSYQLTPRLKVGTGVSYFEDEREVQSSAAVGAAMPLGPKARRKFDSVNPRVYMRYTWIDDFNTYASAAKGFRSGGFNPSGVPYDPESIWTYELGVKTSLAGGRVSTSAALFHSEYSHYQVSGIVRTPPTGTFLNRISNAGAARIDGVEWELTWRPSEQWNLGLSGSYIDSEFVEINTEPNPVTGAPSSAFVVGDALDLVPKYSYALWGERRWNWDSRAGLVRLDYSQQGRSTYRNRSIGPWYYGETDTINLLALNASLQWNERLSLGLFADNLLNDRGHTSPFAQSDNVATRARPRTVGIEFGVSFD